jgi:ATP-dependent exoDNAse (exonuclease V) alpha subunit
MRAENRTLRDRSMTSLGRPWRDLTLAYAITVHSAHGSQFRRVLILVAPTRCLHRSLVDTAVARAVKTAVFVVPPDVLAAAISR